MAAQLPTSDEIPPIRPFLPLDQMCGEDETDDRLLHEAADRATGYIRACQWCIEIHERFFSDGIAGIIALFVFRVSIRKIKTPQWIWVFVGDVPSCYLETDGFPGPKAALLRYIEGVEEWIAASPEERTWRPELPPVTVPPGEDFIEMLKSRMLSLREIVLPHLRDE